MTAKGNDYLEKDFITRTTWIESVVFFCSSQIFLLNASYKGSLTLEMYITIYMSMGPLDHHGQLLKSSSPSVIKLHLWLSHCKENPPFFLFVCTRFCVICSCPLVDGASQRVESPQIDTVASSMPFFSCETLWCCFFNPRILVEGSLSLLDLQDFLRI